MCPSSGSSFADLPYQQCSEKISGSLALWLTLNHGLAASSGIFTRPEHVCSF
jgi:hypothetical protein